MNVTRTLTALMLAAIFTLMMVFFFGCAAPQVRVGGIVPIALDAPTLILTGPASGHWGEENEHPVVAYTVRGSDCRQLSNAGIPEIEFHGKIILAPGETFCVLPLRVGQRVMFSAVRP